MRISDWSADVCSSDLPHKLNVSFDYVEGESLIMALKDLAVSSGSACTSASLEPSYVLRALGRSDQLAHSSIRFTLGRYTTQEEVDFAIQLLVQQVRRLRELSPLWEMDPTVVDLNSVEWSVSCYLQPLKSRKPPHTTRTRKIHLKGKN